MVVRTKRGVVVTLRTLLDAIDDLPSAIAIFLHGKPLTAAKLAEVLTHFLELYAKVDGARLLLADAMKQRKGASPDLTALLKSARSALEGVYGADSPELLKFGFKPRKKPGPRTTEKQIVAVAKARATRALRHTMGPKQKAAIRSTAEPRIVLESDPATDGTAPARNGGSS